MTQIDPELRRWIYGVIAAVVPLLVMVGTLTDEVAQQVMNITAAVLAVGGSALAISNVPNENKKK